MERALLGESFFSCLNSWLSIFSITFICLVWGRYECATVHLQRSEQALEVGSLLSPYAFQGSNSSCKAWCQALLPTEPPWWPGERSRKTLNLWPFCCVWILGPHFWISPQDATCLTSTLNLFPFKTNVFLTPRVFAIRTQCRETQAKSKPRWERKRLTDITIGPADLVSAIWLTNVVGSMKELLKIKGLPSRSKDLSSIPRTHMV